MGDNRVCFDFSQSKILVVGDVMLDKYYFGKVLRISPEAPVPVVKVDKTVHSPGGAANVANNIAHLKGMSYLTGLVGKDNNKKILSDILDKIKVNVHFVENEMPTITKIRVIGEHQQIVRLDFEEIREQNPETEAKVISKVDMLMNEVKGVVISDYGKGVCTDKVCKQTITQANQKGIFTVIDPKGSNWNKYRGASIVTPNVKELGVVVNREILNNEREIEKYGLEILKQYELMYLLVTRSEQGMTLISSDDITHIHTEAREVFDVSGAGDTVVATLAVAIASGLDVKNAVKLANRAAGIVVGKVGTAPIDYDELMDSMQNGMNRKLLSLSRLLNTVKKLKEQGREIVFTNGCFDLLHKGHITYLREARKLGDVLIIGLNSDASVKRLKGDERPINTQEDRAEVLSALEFVDYIYIFEEDTPHSIIQATKPDILVKGGDYRLEEIAGREFAKKTVILPLIRGYSTTHIEYKIQERYKNVKGG